jgi:hypothetical protein
MLLDHDACATLHDERCVTTYVREKMTIASDG